MSDDSKDQSTLSAEDAAKALAWVKQYWTASQACPICTNTSWQIADRIMAPPSFGGGGVHFGGKLVPLLPVICTRCGYTHIFNAVKMGIVEKTTPAPPKKEVADGN